MRYKIASFDFLTGNIVDIIRQELPENFDLEVLKTDSLQARIDLGRDADFFLAGIGRIPGEVIRAAERLRMIQHQGVGYEKTDVAAASRRNIPVCITPEGTSVGVAEHTVLLILAVYKHLVRISNEMYAGRFPMWEYRDRSFEIYKKTVGLVGFGRIAREVAKRLRGFEAGIVFFDQYIKVPEAEQKALGVTQLDTLEEVLAASDIVSVHFPADAMTKGTVNREFFKKMKPTAIFINTARGDLVNEEDFRWAIENKVIAGAGIDAFSEEPLPPDNIYVKLENVTITPHIAAGTVDAYRTKFRNVSANLLRRLRGEKLMHCINEEQLAKALV